MLIFYASNKKEFKFMITCWQFSLLSRGVACNSLIRDLIKLHKLAISIKIEKK